jgi:hypothetical protein
MHSWKGTLKCFLKACAEIGNSEALETGIQIQQFMDTLPTSEVDTALTTPL